MALRRTHLKAAAKKPFKDDSHKLCSIHVTAEQCCVSLEIGDFLTFHTAPVCRRFTHQMQLV